MRSGVCAKLFQLYKYSMIIQATLNLCCMLCKLRTHKPKLQTRDFDNHIEATCASFAFTKFALLSLRVFAFVPDRNN